MREWLTIKEASKAFRKHPDTIRHIIKKNPEDVMRGEDGKIYIKTALLKKMYALKEIEVEEPKEEEKQEEGVINALLLELEQKNEEINKLQSIIDKITSQQAQLINQQQKISGFLLQAENQTKAEEALNEKKKHWWSK